MVSCWWGVLNVDLITYPPNLIIITTYFTVIIINISNICTYILYNIWKLEINL